jgi:ABC-2 type transport system permease protein
MRVLWRVIVKELIQLRHDRRMIPAMIVGPLVQMMALGFAANMDVTDVPLLLVDRDRTTESRDLIDRFTGSRYFDVVGSVEDLDAVEPWLVRGTAQLVLVVGEGYGKALGAGGTARLQLLVDGTDSSSAVVGMGYASRILAELGEQRVELAAIERQSSQSARIELLPRVWYNADLRSRWFYVPAIVALTLMLLTMILPSMAVVREKEIGTLEQISVTPIRPWQLIVGKLLPFGIIGVANLLLVTTLALTVFRVPLRGSLPVLVLLTLPFLLTTLALGLLASTLVRTQQQAMMTSIFLLMVPMIYLSGLIFPIDNMPPAVQVLTYLIPLRYYNHVIRGVFLKGSGIDVLWPEGLILLGFGTAALLAASRRFRKSLD